MKKTASNVEVAFAEPLTKQSKLLALAIAAGHTYNRALRNVITAAREGAREGVSAIDTQIGELTERIKIEKTRLNQQKIEREAKQGSSGINILGDALVEKLDQIKVAEKEVPLPTELNEDAMALQTETIEELELAAKTIDKMRLRVRKDAETQVIERNQPIDAVIKKIEHTERRIGDLRQDATGLDDMIPVWETPKRGETPPDIIRTTQNGKVLTTRRSALTANRFEDSKIAEALDTYFILKYPMSPHTDPALRVRLLISREVYGKDVREQILEESPKRIQDAMAKIDKAKAAVKTAAK